MKISEYIKEYTNGDRVTLKDILLEIIEFIVEVLKLNKEGMKEEFEDVFHFIQLWLYWRFGFDGEHWKVTSNSVNKFIARKSVWNKIYTAVGLAENISGYVGNYRRKHKVVRHLQRFGINEDKAKQVYQKIVLGK